MGEVPLSKKQDWDAAVDTMERKNLKLAVKNFGPIREGEVEFKPLTVFIGPNNSGKSYMATLLYTLIQALIGSRNGIKYLPGYWTSTLSMEDVATLTEWSRNLTTNPTEPTDNLTDKINDILRRHAESETSELKVSVPSALKEYFGCNDLSELIHRSSTGFSIGLFEDDNAKPLVSIKDEHSDSQIEIDIKRDSQEQVRLDEFARSILFERRLGSPSLYSFVIRTLLRSELTSLGMPEGYVYYLPAGRSGLLQGWQLIASIAVGMIGARVGTQRLEIPSFPGIARDFTQLLLSVMPTDREYVGVEELFQAIYLLENEVLHGRIFVRMNDSLPVMGYRSDSLQMPLNRVSSMISELAPIHLWMTHLLQVGDVLIIDEPEAHLHPENQRLIAQVLVRLMNAGVRVVCTTHSSLILHQLSNHILATSSDKLEKVGFSEHDKLDLGDIGVYLFELAEDGSRIKEVEVDSDFGISEDEFVRVAEQVGEETYQLAT